MSKLRTTWRSTKPCLPDDTALYLISEAVNKRRGLIHGQLDNGDKHCAMGCLFADHPQFSLNDSLIDEVAAVNDSVPKTATNRERWKKVQVWLRWKLQVMAGAKQRKQ